jgi:hypothetical protein
LPYRNRPSSGLTSTISLAAAIVIGRSSGAWLGS